MSKLMAKFSQSCLEVSIFMIRLLRHDDTVHREEDGAARFDDLAEKFKVKFDGTLQWSIEAWITNFPGKKRTDKTVSVLLEP